MQRVQIVVDGIEVFSTNETLATYNNVQIKESEDALPYFDAIRRRSQESFAVLTLNGSNEVIEKRIVTTGLLNSNLVHMREVFCHAIADRAASIMVAHNHPSGTLEASPEDIAITTRLKRAGELLGIRVLDHLIVTTDGHASMKQAGHM